jgi:hypothetical protein
MTFVEELHAAHKARLSRMNAPRPIPVIAQPSIPPQSHDAGWEQMWFYDLLQGYREPRQIVPIREIQEAVCNHYGISIIDLLSERRSRALAFPRQVAIYLCRVLTLHSYTQIGRRFGNRDHTTTIYADKKIGRLYGSDLETTRDIDSIKKVLA